MKNYSLFLDSLTKLISYPSVRGDFENGKPFGKSVYDAYSYFLSLCKSFGFDTVDYDGYIGEAVFGQGEEIGVIGHLDVVPEGNGWDTNPYELTKKDGVFYARGIMDDKAPLLACLFVLKELKDLGVTPTRKFRLFIGCNEESGWEDAEYLKQKTQIPVYGFSPDGNFPVSYAEKGMAIIKFKLPTLKNFSSVKGGTVINAVCGYATAKANACAVDHTLLNKHGLKLLDGNIIESVGKSAHGSQPWLGKNAIKPLFEYFTNCGEDYGRVVDCLFNDIYGLSQIKNEQGVVTFSPDIVCEEDGNLFIKCDCRFPAPVEFDEIVKILDKFGLEYTYEIKHGTQLVEKDGEFVSTLLNAYNTVTGENLKSQSQSGSTFARVFEKGVAFGPEFPNQSNCIHEPNERVRETDLLKMYDIYRRAIFTLAGVENLI